jgi:hypothetical protein
VKDTLWLAGSVALILGGYLYETEGRAEHLPACVRPYAGSVYAGCSRGCSAFGEKLGPLWAKVTGAPPRAKAPVQPRAPKGPPAPRPEDSVLVITYQDRDDLLCQLRVVPKGQRIELRSAEEPVKIIETGISCSDHAALDAYREKKYAEMEASHRAVQAELDRIQSP